MKLFMDESGNGNEALPLIVGAVELGDDADEIEEAVRNLHRRLCAKGSFIGHPKFDDFKKNGFHGSVDPLDVSAPFRELMHTLFFRTYMVTTDRRTVSGTEAERIELMYTRLLGDLLMRHRRESELHCYVEQGEGMQAIIHRLYGSAIRRVREVSGMDAPLPRLNIEMVAKADHMSMAIIDYAMLAVSRWLKAGRPTNPKGFEYRAFRDIEPSISVLYSFELGRISSRKEPLH